MWVRSHKGDILYAVIIMYRFVSFQGTCAGSLTFYSKLQTLDTKPKPEVKI